MIVGGLIFSLLLASGLFYYNSIQNLVRKIQADFELDVQNALESEQTKQVASLRSRIDANAKILGDVMGSHLYKGPYFSDLKNMVFSLTTFMDFPEIRGIQVVDIENTSYAAVWQGDKIHSGKSLPNSFNFHALKKKIQASSFMKQKVGTVIIYYTDQHLMKEIKTLRKQTFFKIEEEKNQIQQYLYKSILWQIIVITVIGIFAVFLFRRIVDYLIINPVLSLAKVSRAIQNGDLTRKAFSNRSDEIGELGFAFNSMTTQLKKILQDLQEKNNELHESRERFQTLFNQAADAIFVHDIKGHLLDVNQAACDSLCYTRYELLRMKVTDIVKDQTILKSPQDLWSPLSHEQPLTLQRLHKRKDSSTFPVETLIGKMILGNKEIYLALARDVSERKLIEERLQHSQKMESIGTLAGGIAHDFNNILGIIIGYTDLSLSDVEDRPKTHQSLQQVFNASLRAKDLVKQILTFSHSSNIDKKAINTIPIVKEVCKFLRSSLPTTIEIKQQIKAKHDLIMADPTQFYQIIMNLCTNAGHAMKEKGGILDVLLDEVFLHEKDLNTHSDLKTGYYLHLEVKDTGYGINKDNLNRIFEPYFTTKDKEEGTGLGLAVVHGIVNDLGGDIKVSSDVSNGTTFHIMFPLIEEIVAQELAESAEPLPRGTETILIIDDESSLVESGKLLLERLGYKVFGATSVDES